MGISLVCRMGPGLSLHTAGHDRSGFRQAAASAADARMVHASQWTASGLRMGVGRCKPTGARLGCMARLQDREKNVRPVGPALSRKGIPEASAELQLVGKPERRRGE